MDINSLIQEIIGYTNSIDVTEEGDHLYSNYEEIVAISWRLQEIHNEIAVLEIQGLATTVIRKFRTMILDPTQDRLHDLGVFESRKITAKRQEWEMSREGKETSVRS